MILATGIPSASLHKKKVVHPPYYEETCHESTKFVMWTNMTIISRLSSSYKLLKRTPLRILKLLCFM